MYNKINELDRIFSLPVGKAGKCEEIIIIECKTDAFHVTMVYKSS